MLIHGHPATPIALVLVHPGDHFGQLVGAPVMHAPAFDYSTGLPLLDVAPNGAGGFMSAEDDFEETETDDSDLDGPMVDADLISLVDDIHAAINDAIKVIGELSADFDQADFPTDNDAREHLIDALSYSSLALTAMHRVGRVVDNTEF